MTSDPVANGDKEIICGHGAVECSVGGDGDMLPLCYNNTGTSGENYKNNVAASLILIF